MIPGVGRQAARWAAVGSVALVCALIPSAAIPASKGVQNSAEPAAAYRHYVACGLSRQAKPAHVCKQGRKKGAFFRANNADVSYSVCVQFPTGRHICAPSQEAARGELYVNEITSNIPGPHKVTWFVKGKRVGLFKFTVSR